jgi:hypothetical protein
MSPIQGISPKEFVVRLPEFARRDLMEWNSDIQIETMAENILSRQTDIGRLLSPEGEKMAVTDDFPYNEYFFLRRLPISRR